MHRSLHKMFDDDDDIKCSVSDVRETTGTSLHDYIESLFFVCQQNRFAISKHVYNSNRKKVDPFQIFLLHEYFRIKNTVIAHNFLYIPFLLDYVKQIVCSRIVDFILEQC